MQENATAVLEHKICNARAQYYEQNPKALIFKQNQKLECAAAVSQNISLDVLFKETILIVPNTNRIYLNYAIFKTFAHPLIYDQLVDYIIGLFNRCIQENGNFELNINLQSFTITAAQRYKEIARIFCNRCLARDSSYSACLVGLHIYNCPRMVDTLANLFSTFVDDTVRAKVVLHSEGFGDL